MNSKVLWIVLGYAATISASLPGSALVVISVALLAACFFPAWPATRIDPVQALRD